MSILEITAVVANIALALSLIVGLIFGIAQVQAARRDRRERLTMETIRNFQTKEFAELLLFTSSHKMPATRQELSALPEHERINFVAFAQQMESLGILVAEGLINLDLVDKTLGDFVSTAWQKYKPVMSDMREKQPDPFLAEYFQWLAERIDQRMKNAPRKPFHEDPSTAKCID